VTDRRLAEPAGSSIFASGGDAVDFQIIALIAFGLVSLLNALAKRKKAAEARRKSGLAAPGNPASAADGTPGHPGTPGGKRPNIPRPSRTAAGGAASPVPAPPTEFDQALAEIRQVLGMGKPSTGSPGPTGESIPEPWETSGLEPAVESKIEASDEFHRVVTGRSEMEDSFEAAGGEWKTPGGGPSAPGPGGPSVPDPSGRKVPAPTSPSAAQRFHRTEAAFESNIAGFSDPLKDHSHRARRNEPKGAAPPSSKERRERFIGPDSLRRAVVAAIVLESPRSKKPFRRR
jgi:hypothetical protein